VDRVTAAGWYRAEGDPPGTQRYWDGTQWVGDPVYEPAPAPTSPTPPPPPPGGVHGAPQAYAYGGPVAASNFPTGLKITAIIMSVLKAIPLAFLAIAAVFLSSVGNDFDDQFGNDFGGFDDFFDAAAAVLIVIVLIGAVLLGFQMAGAIKERPIMLFVPALIIGILDVLLMLGGWGSYFDNRGDPFLDDGPGGPVFFTVIAAVQVYIAVAAIRANSR